MESFEDSNCPSLGDGFSLYERYMKSFKVVDNFVEENNLGPSNEDNIVSSCGYDSSSSRENIDLSVAVAVPSNTDRDCGLLDSDPSENCHLTYKPEAPVLSSEESKLYCFKQPVFITPTMENSNNAVDSVPLFRDVRPSDSVFKLPISELSFNGTIKHVQKLKPMIDPISALSSSVLHLDEKSNDNHFEAFADHSLVKPCAHFSSVSKEDNMKSDTSSDRSANEEHVEVSTAITSDSECNANNVNSSTTDGSNKWNQDQSYSSLEASFDSGVRSPDMFSDDDEYEPAPPQLPEPVWGFVKDFEAFEKKKVKKIELNLQGVLPPPSVTILKIDSSEMLKKYYNFLPAFDDNAKEVPLESSPKTPTKRVSFLEIPQENIPEIQDISLKKELTNPRSSLDHSKSENDLNTSDRSIQWNMCSEKEAKETLWPDLLKCKYYDIYYNVSQYSEKFECLAQKYAERYVGAETDSSVNIYAGGLQSPSSASKRKATRLMMAQAKSPGRRLSHLARRRQAFCSAATINEKAQATISKMVLIDKNFFPHRKLVSSAERKSPRSRLRRTPGKRTPGRKTPGKKTPAKTPKTKSGGSSRKKAMRRLLMDPDTLSRSQPTRETTKRALFISPEQRKPIPQSCSSAPSQMRTRRALFGSPVRAETKSMDGTISDQFMKRKRDALGDDPETSRSKIAKSLSFGGDSMGSACSSTLNRRASEVLSSRNSAELNDHHKKKLLWAVSEALRAHGWRMSSPGFREKASQLARLTRRLLSLPKHAARFAAPQLSSSDTMFKLARQYSFAIIQGRTVEDCFEEEQIKLANETNNKITGYISATAYQQLKARQASTLQIKENTGKDITKMEPKSNSKNILQDKLVNIDSNSSNSNMSMLSVGLYKSNSMPSFEEAAKMRARRQISFDNIDFPKR